MTAGVVELPDNEGLYAAITVADVPKALLRKRIGQLGRGLARAVRDAGRSGERVLCVVVLRGGALLYPAFADEFGDAAFCMLGLRRVGGDVVTEYRTEVPGGAYDRIVYLDCVAATGCTIFAARRTITPRCHAAEEVVAVVCAATTATRALHASGLQVIGFSLDEAETSGGRRARFRAARCGRGVRGRRCWRRAHGGRRGTAAAWVRRRRSSSAA